MKSQKRNRRSNFLELVKSFKDQVEQIKEEGLVFFKEDDKKAVPPVSGFSGSATLNTAEEGDKSMRLKEFYNKIKDCKLCGLGKTRINFVFGDGNPDAKVVFIGEAPGADEDAQGKPFVGRAGQLLTKIIESINFKREDVFIMNVLKCRPPNNRPPEPEEMEKCKPYLQKQLEIIRPLIICTLGNPATQTLLNTKQGISKLRGTILDWNGIEVIPTYHPSACLRFPKYKVDVWKDVKLIRKEYDRLCGSSN